MDEPPASWFYVENGSRVGPTTADELEGLLRQGKISHETLVWNRAFGQHWKTIQDSGLEFFKTEVPPPLPPSHVNNTFAWVLAFIPIVGAVSEKIVEESGTRVSPTQLLLAYATVNSLIAIIDATYIGRSGRNVKHIKLGIWFWLIPIYLFQRARAVGRSFAYFWVWVMCFIGAIFVSTPEILSGNTYWGVGVPACDSSFVARQVKNVFGSISTMRFAGISAVDIRNPTQTSASDKIRGCRASILGSDATTYNVNYTIELRDDQIFTQVQIVP